MKTEKIRGVSILIGKRDELLLRAKSLLGVGGVIFTPNPVILELAKRDSAYRDLLNSADLNIPDGVGIRLALARRGIESAVYPGVELGEALLSFAESFAIFGAREGVAAAAAENLTKRYGKRACAVISGYGYDIEAVRSQIAAEKPDLCFVCLGAPRQEKAVNMLRSASPKTLFLALGGAADVYSGRVKRAPEIARNIGAEWLYRIIREPRRLSALPKLFGFFFGCVCRGK